MASRICETIQLQIGDGMSQDDTQLVVLSVSTALMRRDGCGVALQQTTKRLAAQCSCVYRQVASIDLSLSLSRPQLRV